MLHPDDPFYGDVYNDYDLFSKNDDSMLPQPQSLTLAQRMERAVHLGLDEKNITAKYVAGKKIVL